MDTGRWWKSLRAMNSLAKLSKVLTDSTFKMACPRSEMHNRGDRPKARLGSLITDTNGITAIPMILSLPNPNVAEFFAITCSSECSQLGKVLQRIQPLIIYNAHVIVTVCKLQSL